MHPKRTYTHAQPADLQDAEDYLQSSLDMFEHDPADSEYQRGYEAALRELQFDLGWLPI